ncbi:hypothetical protein IEQ11_02675 [Lysobacter capsici]|uniref:hypothetical protein n=1 Tax=Lysobacter capsici TaxID=435897 RepID=UPI001781E4D2|nr:hypothetical protein [Lysobacter capsici]UOF15589.1 hypothetical protein IEQ11_02675 [Lysobacter capsici]
MTSKSAAIVGFIANLMPLYEGEHVDDHWCARSLTDGTLILPFDEAAAGIDAAEEQGWVRVRWQGDPNREIETYGSNIATLAVVRYVELHQVGQPAKRVISEVEGLAQHFTFKTGCSLYLPYDKDISPDLVSAVKTAVNRIGEKALIGLLLKAMSG